MPKSKNPVPSYPDAPFREMAQLVPAMLWVSGQDHKCSFFNKTWLEFTGRSSEDELASGWADGLHPDDYQTCTDTRLQKSGAHEPFQLEYRLKRHDGVYRHIIEKAHPHFAADGTFFGFIVSCTDVRDAHSDENPAQEKRNARAPKIAYHYQNPAALADFYGQVFDAYVDVVTVHGTDGEFLFVNSAAKKIYGFGDEVIGKKVLEVFPQARNSNGVKDLERALGGETIHNLEYKSAVVDVYYENFLIPLKRDDKVYAVLVVGRDISERVLLERDLKAMNTKLTHQNLDLQSSNEDLESFNYIASHDLQEPLRKVAMFAGRILDRDGANLSEQSRDYFDRLTSAISRMQSLIRSLLEYSRMNSDDIKFARTNLNKLVKEVKLSLDEVISEKHAVVESDELPSIQVVSVQFQQLLHNLISNALKYSKNDVPPIVRISAEKVTVPERNDQEFWKISVADNGIGFDMAYKHKIFELFQRLHGKMEYEGTGIGLAICRKIANIHHGFISVDSSPGVGSTFEVYIPVKIKF